MPRPSPWAVLSCVIYISMAFTVGEVFPFSTFSMYSKIGDRVPHRDTWPEPLEGYDLTTPRAAIITARVNGRYERPENFHRFNGLDETALIAPGGWSSSMQYRVDEVRHWLHVNKASSSAPSGPVGIEIGFILIEATTTGVKQHGWQAVARGSAWRVQ